MSKTNLIVMCGCPNVGKSFWAKVIQDSHENCITISENNIRYSMFGKSNDWKKHYEDIKKYFYNAIKNSINSNKYIIADATNLTREERDNLFSNIPTDRLNIIGIWVETPMKTAIKRNEANPDWLKIDSKYIEEAYKIKVSPQEDEPFDELIFISDAQNYAIGTKRIKIMPIVEKLKNI